MTKLLLALVFFMFIVGASNAQVRKFTTIVYGKVNTEKDLPASSVIVSLLKYSDSSIVKRVQSRRDGTYEIPVSVSGKYLLSYNLLGYTKTFSPPFEIEKQPRQAIALSKLVPELKGLKDVTVSSKKSPIEVKPGMMVVNVENSINSTGTNAMELLRKSPGIQIDNDDNISLMGKSATRIYIDGRPSSLDAKSLGAYLRGISSSDVEAIELITSPGAKYEASGSAGVINIRLKKNKMFGSSGNIQASVGQGVTPKTNIAASFNYRNKKINFYSNVSGRMDNGDMDMDTRRLQQDTLLDEVGWIDGLHNKSMNIKGGMDFFIDSRNTLGFMVTTNLTDADHLTSNRTNIYYNPTSQMVRILDAKDSLVRRIANNDFNINYRLESKNGFSLAFDGDYGLYRSTQKSYQPNHYTTPLGAYLYDVNTQTYTPTDIDIYSGKVDIEQKFLKGKLSYGSKLTFARTDNDNLTFSLNEGLLFTDPVKDQDESNQFKYKENVNAAYFSYEGPLSRKLSFVAGLRVEQTNSEGILSAQSTVTQGDQDVSRHYFDWFPNLSFDWKINELHTLSIAYSRRIDRPNYQQLNPFKLRMDQLTYMYGNAFLKPMYTDNIALTHTFMGFINTSVSYSHISDFSTKTTDTSGTAVYITQQNIGRENQFTFNLNFPMRFSSKWFSFMNFWATRQYVKGVYNQKNVNISNTNIGAFGQETFLLPNDYSLEISGWVIGPTLWSATGKVKSMGSLDLGLQKTFMQKRASLKLSLSDLLGTGHSYSFNSNFSGLDLHSHGTWDGRTCLLTFSYRFGGMTGKPAAVHKTALDEDSKRLNSGDSNGLGKRQ